jgi:hypothetical protein
MSELFQIVAVFAFAIVACAIIANASDDEGGAP